MAESLDRRLFAAELKPGHHVTDDTARNNGVVADTETRDADPVHKVLVWFEGDSHAAPYWADETVSVTRASSPEFDEEEA